MANGNDKTLTAEQEKKLRQPIDEYIGKIQKKIDILRADGTDQVVSLQNHMDAVKRDRSLSKGEKETRLADGSSRLRKAKTVEEENKKEIAALIASAEVYLKEHYDRDYYQPVKASCEREKEAAKERYRQRQSALHQEHQKPVSYTNLRAH